MIRNLESGTILIIAGPTAVGKTSVAISIAKHLGTEIISADSRQCYKEMNIGVARPSEQELTEVKHHFIASHSIHQKVNAATFEQYALDKTKDILSRHDNAVMVGGTGLYIKAFCEGMDEIPDTPVEIRTEINAKYEQHGMTWLQEQVRLKDPEFYQKGEIQNPHRLMRALEVFTATGKSILSFRKGHKAKRDFKTVKIALQLPKELLHQNINTRVDQMMEAGLLEEVRVLLPYQHLNALQTVGYKELFAYLNAEISLSQAIEDIKKNTRQYAKRQMTWFRKDKEYQWFDPREINIRDLL
jgi:tRNA dimethylallyltransferase